MLQLAMPQLSRLGLDVMWDVSIIILRVVALPAGLLLLYSLFLYEEQERELDKQVQNLLSEWWVKIDDAKDYTLSVHTAFMQEVARLTTAGFDRLFGNRIISLQSVGVSGWYSIASIFLAVSLEAVFAVPSPELSLVFRLLIIAISLVFVLFFVSVGTLPAFIPRVIWLTIWCVLLALGSLMLLSGLFIGYSAIVNNPVSKGDDPKFIVAVLVTAYGSMCIALMIHVITDAMFIAITRKLLRWSSGLHSFLKITGLILLNLILAFTLIKAPLLLENWISEALIDWESVIGREWGMSRNIATLIDFAIFNILKAFAASNFITALFSFVFIVLGGVMLLHRLFWPLLDRPIYALQKLGFIRRKKLAFTLGIALIGVAVGGKVPSLLKDLLGTLSG
jgi:hypothetical protein